jgi:hypothetical protein
LYEYTLKCPRSRQIQRQESIVKQKRTLRNLLGFMRTERTDSRSFAIGFLAVVGLVGSVAAAAAIDMASTPPTGSLAVSANASSAVSSDAGWSTLSATQRGALAPLRQHWGALDATTQARWIHVADRLQGMPASAVARAQARMEAWQHLPQERREHARQRFELAARLSAQERARRWQQYEANLDARAAARNRSVVRAASAPPTPTQAVLHPVTAPAETARPATEAIKAPSGAQAADLPS